jgi:protoporphyrinogen oxidase
MKKESIAIIGGGITGITAALELAKTGLFQITLFEKDDNLGGLSNYYEWADIVWDRFYHVVLNSDTELLKMISELGLESKLFWRESKWGFYGEGKLVSLSSNLDFIKFPFMSFWEKLRLALGIIYCSRIKDPTKLDRIYVRQWLTKVFGRRVYEKIWDPLLRAKLGDAREKTSAAFIWASITRSYNSNSSGSKIEKIGHVHGGYKTILQAVQRKLISLDVKIRTGSPVVKIETVLPGGITTPNHIEEYNENSEFRTGHIDYASLTAKNYRLRVSTNDSTLDFDKILFTIHCPAIIEIIENDNGNPYWKQLSRVQYLRVICVFLVLKRKLSSYYVTFLLDKELPFTGIIEATNVVSTRELNDKHIVYLPKYMPLDDPMKDVEDDEILELFISNLKKVYPDLDNNDILHKKVFRETYVQPLQELDFLNRDDGFKTPIKNVYLVNSSMIYNSTLNNNAAIKLAQKASKQIIRDAETHK